MRSPLSLSVPRNRSRLDLPLGLWSLLQRQLRPALGRGNLPEYKKNLGHHAKHKPEPERVAVLEEKRHDR
jgi:hypothetical protein